MIMAQKPSIPKGTRDFGPAEMAGRNYIFDTIRSVFKTYGYAPIETPSMENLSTLLGKYGEEGDKLLFRILNSGDAFSKINYDEYRVEGTENGYNSKALSLKVCEKGLRYDLTVPFARFVVQHQNDITFPFKRFQIQPVWRADRPQKGRYREFYQCDVDVIGSTSQLNELELVQIVDRVFTLFDVNDLIREAADLCHTGEDLAVVDLHTYIHVKKVEHSVHDLHKLKLIELRSRADHVDITLIELSVASLLRTVCAPYRLDLESLERECNVVLMLNYKTCKRHCKVVTKTFFAHLQRKSLAVVSVLCTFHAIFVVVDI